jgi:hypothetical protein
MRQVVLVSAASSRIFKQLADPMMESATPEPFATFLRADAAQWLRLIKMPSPAPDSSRSKSRVH